MLFIFAKYKTTIIDCLMKQFYAKWMKTPGIGAQICNPSSWECLSTFQEWSSVRRILSACEKTSRSQGKSLMISISSKTWNCSWKVLSCPSQVQRTGQSFLQITHYNCYCCLYVSMEKCAVPRAATCSLSLRMYTLLTWLYLTRI